MTLICIFPCTVQKLTVPLEIPSKLKRMSQRRGMILHLIYIYIFEVDDDLNNSSHSFSFFETSIVLFVTESNFELHHPIKYY